MDVGAQRIMEYVTMHVFQEMNTSVTEKMKDLMTGCAEYAERYEKVTEMISPLMRDAERLSDETEKMAVTAERLADTKKKLVDRVDRQDVEPRRVLRILDEGADEIDECAICGKPCKQVLCEDCTHGVARKGGGKGARRRAGH